MNILNKTYTKTEFSKRWSNIVSSHASTAQILGAPKDFILEALKFSKHKMYGWNPHTTVRVDFAKYRQRNVQVVKVCLARRCENISKAEILSVLFPSKPKNLGRAHRAKVLNAMRALIIEQIEDFNNQFAKKAAELRKLDEVQFAEHTTCMLSGKNLMRVRTAVDHVDPPFIDIAEAWFKLNNIDSEKVQLKFDGKFANDSLNLAWQAYHLEHAKLAVVCAKANLKKSNKSLETFYSNG